MAEELIYLEKWSLGIHELQLGALASEGGSSQTSFKVGGETTLPFLFKEGRVPHRPLIAAEVSDVASDDWPPALIEALGCVSDQPLDWATMMMEETGADLISLRLAGTHPDFGDKTAKESADLVTAVLKKIKTPLIVLGCGYHEKDNEVLPICSEATKGERLLFGDAVQENYKTLTAACLADGHNILAESPIDVNIAKQLNILITDMGMPPEKIIINPTIGALGYGLEYAYSIMERARLAALSGDKMLAMPFLCLVGEECWRVKEARAPKAEAPLWGDPRRRGIMWEVTTAMAMLQAGAGILTLQHPEAIKIVKAAAEELFQMRT